jgi:glycosyltransferase involved in cell wall biosynthesis
MTEGSEILVFVPTYNDKELLMSITQSVFELPGDFVPLVVDDGSSIPVTKSHVAAGTLLARLPTNVGLGAATHVAFDHACKHGYSIVARLDSDGQHPVSSLPKLVEPLQSKTADMVVGHRLNRDDGNGLRDLLAKSIRWYLTRVSKIISGGKTPQDMNTGYFAVTIETAAKLNTLRLERYPEPQIFLSADLLGINIVEYGITQNVREYGRSTLNIAQALLLLYRFHMLLLERFLVKTREK